MGLLRWVVVLAAYVMVARLGLGVGAIHETVSPFWLTTGLAIAALTLWELQLWSAIAIGAFLVNFLFAGHQAPIAAGIAVGNTLEAVLGALMLRRLSVRGEVKRVRDATAILAAAGMAPLASATTGVLCLALGGFLARDSSPSIWVVWWVGDFMGALIALPLLLAWLGQRSAVKYPSRPIEFAGVVGLAGALTSLAHLNSSALTGMGVPSLPLSAFLFPPMVWAVLRLRPRETALVMALASGLAVMFTVAGTEGEAIGPLLSLQMRLLAVVGGSLLLIGALAERARVEQALAKSERRLVMALEVSASAVWEMDVAESTVRGDNLLFTGLGYAPDELTTRSEWKDLIHREDQEAAYESLEEVIQGQRERCRVEVRFRAKDGRWRWMLTHAIATERDAQGRALRLLGTLTDTSERRQTEEALRASEEKFRTLFTNMTEGFALGEPILDEQGRPVSYRYLVVNEAFHVQTGIPHGIQGLPIRDYLPQLEQYWIDRYCAVALTGKPDRVDAYNADTRRHYDVYVFSPSPGKFAILFRDITEQRKLMEELEKFKFFSDFSSEGNLVGNAEGRIRYVNRRLCESLGYSEEELFRLRFQDIAPSATPALLTELVQRTKQGDNLLPFESIRRRKDGSTFPVEVSATALDVKGEWQVLMVSRDITERKRAEQALKESERRLAMALQASASAVWEMDVAAGTVRGEDRFFTMLGYAPGQLTALADWWNIVHPDDREDSSVKLEEVIQGRCDRHWAEARVRAKDGNWRWILSQSSAAERDAEGRALRLVGTHTDITERKAAEAQIKALNAELENRVEERTAQLQEANEALLQSNTELKQFAHATAHDLQTPLRSIAGFTQLLQKEVQGRGNAQVDEWAATVVENTKRLQILIRDLLSYTRLETQGLPLVPTDLNQLFDEVVASLAVLIGETRAEVTRSALPALPVDRTQMAQVFQNLIENGIKYNRSNPPRVAVAGEHQGEQWVFSVADNGIGIDPKHFDRVFALFQRLHPYHEFPGTGIGVPLSRRIVERHGGHMWIESRPGEGSTFYFSLPVERSKAS